MKKTHLILNTLYIVLYKYIMVTLFESSDGGIALLERTTRVAIDDVNEEAVGWLNEVKTYLGTTDDCALSTTKFGKPKKDTLCSWLEEVCSSLRQKQDRVRIQVFIVMLLMDPKHFMSSCNQTKGHVS